MKEVGSVEVKYDGKTSLLVVTEEKGFIHINGKYLPVSHNVEDSIRWIMKIPKHLYMKITYFAAQPKNSKFTKSNFLQSYWEDFAANSVIVIASIIISTMSDDWSDPDSVS
jgi:hypothetical protein